MILTAFLCLSLLGGCSASGGTGTTSTVLVCGSVNADIIVPLQKLPALGETVVALDTPDSGLTVAGGKGANQAVSCSRLGADVSFACQLGNDANADMLERTLLDNRLDLSLTRRAHRPSGMGLVFLQDSGATSCVVIGGSNAVWPEDLAAVEALIDSGVACVMLQMEIPQAVNERIAAKAASAGVPVFQDVGGEDRPISDTHLKHCTYVSPNLTELRRLTGMHVDGTDEESIVAAARSLQTRGARNVLVTLGDCGSMLLAEDGRILWQSVCPVESVVDETGAGDNFRGAFVVAHFIDMLGLEESLQFASAAGAVSVSKMGAIPSCGTREEVQTALARMSALKTLHLRGGVVGVTGTADPMTDECPCPYEFASRLNSMQARPELWSGPSGVRGWVRRQGLIKGLSLVDFNYPQHITAKTVDSEARDELLATLQDSGLRCGAVCLRFPKSMQLGAFTHPDAAVRREAIQLTKEACAWSAALGANEVVVWSAFDGYDYPLQADYDAMWVDVVSAFQEVCDAYPGVKVSLEYKPTDENTRFFAVPSTGAAVLLIGHVDRANFGLTLDFGHCLMAGENPAQAVAMVPKGKLFGVQLGDGYGRLGAEDGLAFASVHPRSALEFVVWLIKKDFRGHIYFDTFPRNEDPVREAEYNIRQFRRLYSAARKMLASGRLEEQLLRHDSMAVLEDLESMSL